MCSATSGRLREFKDKEKDHFVIIPKGGRVRLRMPGAVAY